MSRESIEIVADFEQKHWDGWIKLRMTRKEGCIEEPIEELIDNVINVLKGKGWIVNLKKMKETTA